MTNEALAAVTAPFVSFEQPFESRPGRFERQIEASRHSTAAVILTDTWPDAFHDTTPWGGWHKAILRYVKRSHRHDKAIWPESAIYATEVAKLFTIDESIRYRPQMHFFCQYYDSCCSDKLRGHDITVSPEAGICVEDRMIYPATYPKLELPPAKLAKTILAVGGVWSQASDGVEVVPVSEDVSVPLGQRINDALLQSVGELILIEDSNYEYDTDRFERQTGSADLSLSPVRVEDGVEAWKPYNYEQDADVPTGQLASFAFSRKLIEELGGVHPDMSVGVGYDLFLRALNCRTVSYEYLSEPLLSGAKHASHLGVTYTQQVYNDITNRARFTQGCHHIGIRRFE
jgi:hypothetical protein